MADDAGEPGLDAIGAALTARAQARRWAVDAQLLALLDATHRAGWLAHLDDEIAAEELAGRVGVGAERVADVLAVLAAGGIAERRGRRFGLTPAFSALSDGASGVDVGSVLGDIRLQRARLEAALRPGSEPRLDGEAALVLAEDWGVRLTPGAQSLYATIFDAFPALRDRLTAGGPFLDVGSGVGGATLSTVSLFADLHAVGVEIVPEIADELRRRVAAAGFADRVEIRCVDARTLADDATFAAAYWAQEFFDAEARAETLSAIFRALEPGGLLMLQELSPEPAGDDPPIEWLLDRLFYRGMGASFGLSVEHLISESLAAGFSHQQTNDTPAGRIVLLSRP